MKSLWTIRLTASVRQIFGICKKTVILKLFYLKIRSFFLFFFFFLKVANNERYVVDFVVVTR